MCTVVYYKKKTKIFIASLRDENINRAEALPPFTYNQNEIKFIAPKDGLAAGSWIGINENGTTIVLLNGGFINHIPKENYSESRGTIVISMLTSNNPIEFWQNKNMDNLAPHTLIFYSNDQLYQLVWDGNEKKKYILDKTTPYIWSSATLYDKHAAKYRENLFNQWLQTEPVFTKNSLLQFFKEKTDHLNGFIIKRDNEISTLSYSFIELLKDEKAIVDYIDLRNNVESKVKISIRQLIHDFN